MRIRRLEIAVKHHFLSYDFFIERIKVYFNSKKESQQAMLQHTLKTGNMQRTESIKNRKHAKN